MFFRLIVFIAANKHSLFVSGKKTRTISDILDLFFRQAIAIAVPARHHTDEYMVRFIGGKSAGIWDEYNLIFILIH